MLMKKYDLKNMLKNMKVRFENIAKSAQGARFANIFSQKTVDFYSTMKKGVQFSFMKINRIINNRFLLKTNPKKHVRKWQIQNNFKPTYEQKLYNDCKCCFTFRLQLLQETYASYLLFGTTGDHDHPVIPHF